MTDKKPSRLADGDSRLGDGSQRLGSDSPVKSNTQTDQRTEK